MAGTKVKFKSLAEQIAELEDPTPKDFDPEDQNDGRQTSDEERSEDERGHEYSGREHYQFVGKSALRKPLTVELGSDYASARISRDALRASDSEDESALSEDIDKEEPEASDEEGMSELEDDEGMEPDEGLSAEDEHASDDMASMSEASDEDAELESDQDEEDDEDEDEAASGNADDDREELRRILASDHKVVAASISQAAKADAAKGAAVKRQRRTFDALLNSRIKLQKGLTSLQELAPDAENDSSTPEESIKSAETAAISLWNALDDLRHVLADSRSKDASTNSKKRKRTQITSETSTSEIWNRMSDLEAQSVPHRRAILDKWSIKARGVRAALPSGQHKLIANKSDSQTITTVLDAHLATEISAISSKSKDAKNKSDLPAAAVYDDTAFYQSLLRDLVEQRMASSATGPAIDSHLPSRLTGLSINPTTGMRKDKVKREVDTKASKGRKMKYNVHEKLQNFMAPEERGAWGERARDEFFASLLGRSAREVLGEDDEDGSEESDVDMEESGLRLFRS